MTFRQIRTIGNRFDRITAAKYAAEAGQLPPNLPLDGTNLIVCRDGYRFSAIAGYGAHCLPRSDFMTPELREMFTGPYTHVECGFWDGHRPKPAKLWRPYLDDDCGPEPEIAGNITVYSFVPVRLVYDLINHHGGQLPHDKCGVPFVWTGEHRARRVRNRGLRWARLHSRAASLGIRTR